jgi:hypothetical protein
MEINYLFLEGKFTKKDYSLLRFFDAFEVVKFEITYIGFYKIFEDITNGELENLESPSLKLLQCIKSLQVPYQVKKVLYYVCQLEHLKRQKYDFLKDKIKKVYYVRLNDFILFDDANNLLIYKRRQIKLEQDVVEYLRSSFVKYKTIGVYVKEGVR